jgi:hypothetical protein
VFKQPSPEVSGSQRQIFCEGQGGATASGVIPLRRSVNVVRMRYVLVWSLS